jgi:hypothetical protein
MTPIHLIDHQRGTCTSRGLEYTQAAFFYALKDARKGSDLSDDRFDNAFGSLIGRSQSGPLTCSR